jgi:DNA-binding NtrC family response regulator
MNSKPSSTPSALVFDRASMVAETVAMVLDDAGYNTRATMTYRDARRAFQELGDLVLMVVHADTPGEKRGRELLNAALRERPDTAIVIVSSRLPEDLEPAPRSAVFLVKPFDREQLLDAVERARLARPVT